MGFFTSLLFGFLPMFLFAVFIYWMDRYEKEPKILLGAAFTWGAVIAAGGAFLINTMAGVGIYMFTGSQSVTEFSTGSLVAPIVEESLKGFAVLLVFLIFRTEFDSVLDGIIYAAIVALGFAATENTYYIYTMGYLPNGWTGLVELVFVRVILVGWQHPFYTAFTGIGLATARLSHSTRAKVFWPLLGLLLAFSTHSLHNTLAELVNGVSGMAVSTLVDWSGWLLMFFFILWMIRREREYLQTHLEEEVGLGIINIRQYENACSGWLRTRVLLASVGTGCYRSRSRFFQLCGELSHKKQQLLLLGEERNNSEIILQLREELKNLSLVI